MIIGPTFVFLCIPRCASNTMREWLKQFGGISIEPHHGTDIPAEHRGKVVFAVVRNPYDRMLSMWYHTKRHSPDREWRQMGAVEFARRCAETEYGMSQVDFLHSLDNQLFRYESLNESLKLAEMTMIVSPPAWKIGHREGCWMIPFPSSRLNSEARPSWLKDPALTPDFIAAVDEHSAADFQAFGYERI